MKNLVKNLIKKIKFPACLMALSLAFCNINVYALPVCNAKAYLLMEALTGEVIAGENIDMQLPIASTTKIMTALLTLEQKNLDTPFIVDSEAIKTVGTSMGLRQGDSVTLRNLAVGMLLPSGNDAANSAACRISGSVEKFSDLMNERAQELNMKNTHFVTPSGLDDENHYSSAYDMALLSRHALKNELFAQICKSEKIRVSFGTPSAYRTFYNHNRLLKEYEGCIGIKTGFTDNAKRCLVSAAEQNGIRLICVTLNASDDFETHKQLFDYGFDCVSLAKYFVSTKSVTSKVVGAMEKNVTLTPQTDEFFAVSLAKDIKDEVIVSPFLYAPIAKGDICGRINHNVNGETVAVTPLVADSDIAIEVRKQGFLEKILRKYFF